MTGIDPAGAGSATVAKAPAPKRQILFVDDEPAVLQGLRSVLWTQRSTWDMTFAGGGPAAVEALKSSAFDVVITDMRMPVIGGGEVLRHAKELQPRAVRIVLSGQTDVETAMKTVFTAHQFLAKPCDAAKLRAVVERACELHTLIMADQLKALAGDVGMLPGAPRTYLAISRALANPACRISEVVGLVERDPALCAKVLQVVNSAFFGLPRAVSSIAQATSYLGTLALRNLALAMETALASNHPRLKLSEPELLSFQTNALLTGLIGRRWFAADRRKAEEAFVAGMLRDMGHLVLAARGQTSSCGPDSHAALSGYLLGLWGIPHNVLEPVAFHDHPERLEHDTLEVVDIVNLAERLAAELVPSPFQGEAPPLAVERLAQLGVSTEQIDALRADASQALIQAREMLGA